MMSNCVMAINYHKSYSLCYQHGPIRSVPSLISQSFPLQPLIPGKVLHPIIKADRIKYFCTSRVAADITSHLLLQRTTHQSRYLPQLSPRLSSFMHHTYIHDQFLIHSTASSLIGITIQTNQRGLTSSTHNSFSESDNSIADSPNSLFNDHSEVMSSLEQEYPGGNSLREDITPQTSSSKSGASYPRTFKRLTQKNLLDHVRLDVDALMACNPFETDSIASDQKLSDIDICKREDAVILAFKELRFNDVIQAYSHVRGIGKRKSITADMYIQALDYLGSREQEITDAYKMLRKQKMEILPESYAKIVKAYMRLGQSHRSLNVFQNMRDQGQPGNTELYNVLLAIYAKDDPEDITSPQEIVSQMKLNKVPFDRITLERLLLQYSSQDRHDLVRKTYKELVEEHCVPCGRITYCIMTETMLQEKDDDLAFLFLKQLDKINALPRLRTYEKLFAYLLDQDLKAEADIKMGELRHVANEKPTLVIYNHFIDFYSKRDDFAGIQSTLAQMMIDQIFPDQLFFEKLLQTWYRMDNINSFFDTFTIMLDRRMKPDRHFYSKRIEMLANQPAVNFTMLMHEYEYLQQAGMQPEPSDIRFIMSCFYKQNLPDMAYSFAIEEMPKCNMLLDIGDYCMMLRGWILIGNKDQFLKTWENFLASNIPLNTEPFILGIQGKVQFNLLEQAFEIWDVLKQQIQRSGLVLDDVQAPRLMESFSQLNYELCFPLMQEIYDIQFQYNIKAISLDMFQILIATAAKHQINTAMAYYKIMVQNFNLSPTIDLYKSLFEGLALDTERKQSSIHISTILELSINALYNPNIQPVPTSIVNIFILFFIRHGSHALFSNGMAWFKHIQSLKEDQLDMKESALLRKWLRTIVPDEAIPKEFTSRNLQVLTEILEASES